MLRLVLGTLLCVAAGATHAVGQTPPDAIFSDGFESGDVSAWSAASMDAGDLGVTAGAALAATAFGLEGLVDDTTGLYVQDDTPADENRYRARFYFDPSAFDTGEAAGAHRTRLFIAFEEAPTRRLLAIVLKRQGGQYSVMGRVRRNDGGQADTGFFPVTPGEHWVEIDWVRASSPVAADGAFQMWLDGESVSALSGLANGASAVDFVRLGALSVKPGASGILRWDQFASRRQTPIGASLGSAQSCTLSDQCGSGFCVDNVCCQSACQGACARCDVVSAPGTCTPVPDGTDPDAECGGVSCDGYYYGWGGSTCYAKADVTAGQAECGGSFACRTAAQECTLSTVRGAATKTCDSQCQTPKVGTCTGTTPGDCTNLNPGSRSCGDGVCRVTVPVCVNGAPNTCTPNWAAATTETCNGLDDNCDGLVDNGAFSDAMEPNDDCANVRTLPTVGSNQTQTVTALSLYPSGDVDYFKITATETDSSCSCCDLFCTDEDFQFKVTLTVPAGAGSYQFCTDTACGSVSTYCAAVSAGTSFTWTWSLDGSCGIGNDSYTFYVRISPFSTPGYQCAPYTLSYNFVPGCFGAAPPGAQSCRPEPGGPQ